MMQNALSSHQKNNNWFGIKSSDGWAKYDSARDSFLAYGKLLSKDRYTKHTKNAKTDSEYINGVVKGGYCEEYGEQYIIVANLYKDIIYVLSEAYQYVMSIDQMARMRKQFPEQCQNSLIKLVDEVKCALCKAAINPDILIPTQAQIQEAKEVLPLDIYKKIFKLDIKTLSTTLYHEVPTKYKKAFGILVIERIKMQQNVDDIEYIVFKHITNHDELIEKVNKARLILAHINEFAMLDIIEDGKCETKHIRKGTL